MSGSRVELMTGKEQDRADDMMREEIARQLAEMRRVNDRMQEEIAKLIAETGQFSVLRDLVIPMLAGVAFVVASGAIVKLFF